MSSSLLNYFGAERAALNFTALGDDNSLDILEGLNYNIKTFTLPGLSSTPVNQPAPQRAINQPGDSIVVNPVSVTFLVDEKLKNYFALRDWMRRLYYQDDQTVNYSGAIADMTVSFFDSNNRVTARAIYRDAFPIDLEDINMTTDEAEFVPLQATCQFSVLWYTVEHF